MSLEMGFIQTNNDTGESFTAFLVTASFNCTKIINKIKKHTLVTQNNLTLSPVIKTLYQQFQENGTFAHKGKPKIDSRLDQRISTLVEPSWERLMDF